MNDLEKLVLSYLEKRNDIPTLYFGKEKIDRNEAIRRFKSDEKFRTMVVKSVIAIAVDFLNQ